MFDSLNSAIHHTPGIVQSPIAIMLAATRQRQFANEEWKSEAACEQRDDFRLQARKYINISKQRLADLTDSVNEFSSCLETVVEVEG